MQGMYVMSDVPVAQNMVVQERTVIGGPAVHGGVIGVQQGTLNRGENVVLVERQVGSGQVGGLNQGLVLVEGQVGAGQVLQGGQSWIQQGPLQRGSVSGSQNIMLVEREGVVGQVLRSPVSPQQILLGSPTGLPPGYVQRTGAQNAFVFERQVVEEVQTQETSKAGETPGSQVKEAVESQASGDQPLGDLGKASGGKPKRQRSLKGPKAKCKQQ
ncbi:hypothetical protein SKAU_G00074180 [Synaphobranchus kaupii]|uniref:Uncharacterized protein n=1 Tax=Synaphobranchus kaupii TaxID=118154 RepID=A0A9Q1G7B3_SYNKA|nr:hypothetical protein SKAU_G00074180 [Synaphobranchus kaupii]